MQNRRTRILHALQQYADRCAEDRAAGCVPFGCSNPAILEYDDGSCRVGPNPAVHGWPEGIASWAALAPTGNAWWEDWGAEEPADIHVLGPEHTESIVIELDRRAETLRAACGRFPRLRSLLTNRETG